MFANDLGDQGSISGRVIPKTQKIVLEAFLINTQHLKYGSRVRGVIQGKQSHLPLHFNVVAIEKRAFDYNQSTLYIYIQACADLSLKNIVNDARLIH